MVTSADSENAEKREQSIFKADGIICWLGKCEKQKEMERIRFGMNGLRSSSDPDQALDQTPYHASVR